MRVEFWARPVRGISAAAAAMAAGLVLAGCGGPAGSVAGGDPDPVSTKLFAAFGDACRAHRSARSKAAA